MDWFTLAIISTIVFGIQSFLFKKSSELGCSKLIVTMVFMFTVEVLSLFAFVVSGSKILYLLPTLLFGLLFAVFFYTKTFCDLKALDLLPTSKVFPISSSNAIIVVFYAIIFFNEKLNPAEILGIAILVITMVFIHSDSKKQVDYHKAKTGLIIATLAIIPGAGIKIVNKYAAISSDTIAFTVITYFFLVLVSMSNYKINGKKKDCRSTAKQSIIIGIIIGLVNFTGFYTHLFALKTGSLAIVSTLHSSYVVVTVLLAWLFSNESLTKRQFGMVVLSVIGVILLRVDPSDLIKAVYH